MGLFSTDYKVYIKIHNDTPHKLEVTEVDDMDLGDFGGTKPTKFRGQEIKANDVLEMFVYINMTRRNCPFRMTLESDRGGEDIFKLNLEPVMFCRHYSTSYCEKRTNLRHTTTFHKISTYVDGDRMNIVVELTADQIREDEIKKEIERILKLIALGRYKEALKELLNLYNTTAERFTELRKEMEELITRVKNAIKAEELEQEAEVLMEEKEYAAALAKFQEANRITSEKLIKDRLAPRITRAYRKLHQDAILKEIFVKIEECLKNQRYTEAIDLADEGLDLADKMGVLSRLSTKKSQALTGRARAILREGFKLEAKNSKTTSQQARNKFKLAQETLEAAQELDFVYEQEEVGRLIELKISANELLYQAVEAEKAALEKFSKAKNADGYEAARQDHIAAIHMYEEAQRKVEEGAEVMGEFQANVDFLQKTIQGAKDVAGEMIKLVLQEGIKNVDLVKHYRQQKGEHAFDIGDKEKEYFLGDLPLVNKYQ